MQWDFETFVELQARIHGLSGQSSVARRHGSESREEFGKKSRSVSPREIPWNISFQITIAEEH